jgi:hypothetical protein
MKSFILFFLFAAIVADAQKLKKDDKQLVANLQQHIQFLADDKLEGRRTGTAGETTAANYIASQFKTIGLGAKGTNDYLQSFEINEGKQINPTTFLTIDGKNLVLNKEFFPLAISANATIEALTSLALQEQNTPWFYDLKELLSSNANNPHFDLNEAVIKSSKEAAKRGANSDFLYNSAIQSDGWQFQGKEKLETVSIPVVYLSNEAIKKYFSDESATLDIKL